jgi:protein-S-isoprenylcysteine O-methyltransferase Ste14
MDVEHDSAQVRFPPPLVYLGALLAGLALGALVGRPHFSVADDTRHLAGMILLVCGFAILLTAIGLFRSAGTPPEPWKASQSFVTDGVYRWTRNPMYLGMALAYAGIALMLDSPIALALLVPVVIVIQREVIAREEAYMESRFGDEYRTYCNRVRRWV